jgi:DNA-binding NtrC family response regulator
MSGNALDFGPVAAANVNAQLLPVGQIGDSVQVAVGTPLAVAEKQLIMATLHNFDGNKKKTAETLGISLKTLYNRLTEYRAKAPPSLSAVK